MAARETDASRPGTPRVTTAGEGAPAVTEGWDARQEPVVKRERSGLLHDGRERPAAPLTSGLHQGADRSGFTTRGMVERLGGQLGLEDRTRGARPDAFVRRGAGPERPAEEGKMESRTPRDVLGDAMAAARDGARADRPGGKRSCARPPQQAGVAAGGGPRCSSS